MVGIIDDSISVFSDLIDNHVEKRANAAAKASTKNTVTALNLPTEAEVAGIIEERASGIAYKKTLSDLFNDLSDPNHINKMSDAFREEVKKFGVAANKGVLVRSQQFPNDAEYNYFRKHYSDAAEYRACVALAREANREFLVKFPGDRKVEVSFDLVRPPKSEYQPNKKSGTGLKLFGDFH